MPWLVMGALLGLALLSALLTWAARGYALRQQLMDQPGERRSHSVATPRGGGIAIVISLLVTAGVAIWAWPESTPTVLVASLGLVLVAGIGWWDDHKPLPAMRRLLVHFIAAALLAGLVKVNGGSWLLAALVLLFTASLINIWNFMDGINGIAASQAVVAMLGLAPVLPWPYSLAAVALGLACLGFLPFNFLAPGSSWVMSEVARWGMRSPPCWRSPACAPISTGSCCWYRFRRSSWTPASHCWRASFPDNAGWNPIPSTSTSARCRQEPVTPR